MYEQIVTVNGGESPHASKDGAGDALASPQGQSGGEHQDGGSAAAGIAQGEASSKGESGDPSGVASSGGIMRPMD